ncbi:MAG: hypothetical protein WCH58_01315 [Candidatus Saccharibacteria bacterium]
MSKIESSESKVNIEIINKNKNRITRLRLLIAFFGIVSVYSIVQIVIANAANDPWARMGPIFLLLISIFVIIFAFLFLLSATSNRDALKKR